MAHRFGSCNRRISWPSSTELMHEARVIPLTGRPHVSATVGAYMGDARGRWEGDTLVVETTNIKGSFQLTSAAGPNLRSWSTSRRSRTVRLNGR